MATATYDRPILDLEGVTQFALSTTAAHRAVPVGAHAVKTYGSAAWKLKFAPKLVHAVVYTASTGAYADKIADVTDGSSSTHLPLDAITADDSLYLGFTGPTRGVYITMGSNVNAVASSTPPDVEYCSTALIPGSTDPAFTDVAGDSDGTVSGTTTLATSGLYSWTLPTAWVRSRIGTSIDARFTVCYWIKITPSKTLSDVIDINEIIPAAKNTNYDQLQATTTYIYHIDTARVGAIEYRANEATPNLDLTWIMY